MAVDFSALGMRKVLVRNSNCSFWKKAFLQTIDEGDELTPFLCVMPEKFNQCISFEGNQNLEGTTTDVDYFMCVNTKDMKPMTPVIGYRIYNGILTDPTEGYFLKAKNKKSDNRYLILAITYAEPNERNYSIKVVDVVEPRKEIS